MDTQRKACGLVRTAIVGGLLTAIAGCASNPPPRPMPKPATQSTSQRAPAQQPRRAQTPERQAAGQAAATPAPARETQAQATEPEWFRPGAFEVDGREHRAFSVVAGDVREARGQALQLAYESYPDGHVAAHEAVRQADGSWRFFVLMAAGG